MAANFESGFFVKEPAWHGLGTIINEPCLAEDAITYAGLDWVVEKRPIQVDVSDTTEPDVDIVVPPEWEATMRMDNHRVLGIVGTNYKVVQNLEAFKFMDELAGPGKLLQYHTAGSLAFGRKVWMLATVEDLVLQPVPDDIVQPYLLLANGHDGRLELSVAWTSVRVVCQNTLMLALNSAKTKFSIRHVGDINSKKEQAQEVLGFTRKIVDYNQELLRSLALKQMGTEVLDKFLRELVPDPEDASPTRAENTRDNLKALFEGGPGNDIPGVKGTAWGALNAVTAFTNHHRTVRGGKGDELKEKRLESLWWGSANILNQKALGLLVAV